MNSEATFSLGITYWPRRTGYAGWKAFDAGATRDELAHIADLGCDTVRLCLRWEDFQPGPARINSRAMRALEHTLDAAQAQRLRVVAVLFAGVMGGVIQIPAWATGISPGPDLALMARFGVPLTTSVAPVFFEGDYHETTVRDLYRDRQQRTAQRYLIREVVGYFASHPALRAWQIGYDLDRARDPGSSEEAVDWLADLAEYAREQGATRLLGTTSTHSLARVNSLRPQHSAELCDQVGLHTRPYDPLPVEEPWQVAYVTFLHALTTTRAGQAVVVADLGLATSSDNQSGWMRDSRPGSTRRIYLADEEQQAAFVETAVETLHRAGATGVWLAAYADVPETLWQTAPYDRAIQARTLGIVRADGREKPAAATFRSISKRLSQADHTWMPLNRKPGTMPTLAVDPERYQDNPAGELRRLFNEWQSKG